MGEATKFMKRAGVYSPYWDTLGGGEYYTAQFIRSLLDNNYSVDIFTNELDLHKKIVSRFGLDISDSQVSVGGHKDMTGNLWSRYQLTKNYDSIFYLSDGSIPFLFSRNNILHFQVPFQDSNKSSIFNQMKFRKIHHIVCNSLFTKSYIDKEYRVNSQVIYPPVNLINKSRKKENIILSVGRFDNLMQSKRQDVLIDVFKKMKLENWKLVLIGGVLHGEDYVAQLKKSANGSNIEIISNASHQRLQEYYQKSKIFWHAAGFGLDVGSEPQKAEHFGISVVEAMSAGLIPIVFGAGGPKEILQQFKHGLIWKKENDLVSHTKTAIEMTKDDHIISAIKKFSKKFSTEKFHEEVKKIIS